MTIYLVVIYCGGKSGRCPSSTEVDVGDCAVQVEALRKASARARNRGWRIGQLRGRAIDLCPGCVELAKKAKEKRKLNEH